MTFELRDIIHLATLGATGLVLFVRLDSASKEQTRQHGELKSAMGALTNEVRGIGRETSEHTARIDGAEVRIDRCETRLDLMARRN